MVNPFVCGSGTFHHHSDKEDDEHCPCSRSTTSTPRKSRKLLKTRDNRNKNPYSRFGHDKFSALLAELEGKRQEIYTQMGSEDISFVRFAYSNSNNCKPIVVKARNRHKNGDEHTSDPDRKDIQNLASGGLEKNNSTESSSSQKEVQRPMDSGDRKNKKNLKREKRRAFYYLVAVVVLILLFLAMFGRSFAIILVSVGWYLVPAIEIGKESDRRRRKKRENGRTDSGKKIANVINALPSPKSNGNEAADEISPCRKSW